MIASRLPPLRNKLLLRSLLLALRWKPLHLPRPMSLELQVLCWRLKEHPRLPQHLHLQSAQAAAEYTAIARAATCNEEAVIAQFPNHLLFPCFHSPSRCALISQKISCTTVDSALKPTNKSENGEKTNPLVEKPRLSSYPHLLSKSPLRVPLFYSLKLFKFNDNTNKFSPMLEKQEMYFIR
jgi:hypothetical protein